MIQDVSEAGAVSETEPSTVFRTTEFDLPETTFGVLLSVFLVGAVFWLAVRTSLRDSRFLARGWRVLLLIPRLLLLLAVVVILTNPRSRTQTNRIEPSRVAVLLDTSASMAYPAADLPVRSQEGASAATEADSADAPGPSDSEGTEAAPIDSAGQGGGVPESRMDAVRRVLVGDGLLDRLSRTHGVSVYVFDKELIGPVAVVTDGEVRFRGADTKETDAESSAMDDALTPEPAVIDESASESPVESWDAVFQPQGSETRLTDSLHELLGEVSGRTLSGVVLLSDGAMNAGSDAELAVRRARSSGAQVITGGIGNERPQLNIWVSAFQMPAEVHRGDPFDISVAVRSAVGHAPAVRVNLFRQSAGSGGRDRTAVSQADVVLSDSGVPAEAVFRDQLGVPGEYEYVAEISPTDSREPELSIDDNSRVRQVMVTDRRVRVLLISSGPMRDYQFVRNTFYRNGGIESDVWLQSVTDENSAMVSQEAGKVLTGFPETEAALFEYDVIVAFDPDWSRLTPEQQAFLNRWVDEHAGGLIVVAGEIHTNGLARNADKWQDISVLYPVEPSRLFADLASTQRADEPWPVQLTAEGRSSEFLRLTDSSGASSTELWERFPGVFRSHPVNAVRAGAVVLAEYGNPRARTQDGQPPFLAMQYYGAGRTLFVGSAETWRLRSFSPEGHQQLWTSLVREVGQGRLQRGRSRGTLTVDTREAAPGELVTVRARVFDADLKPLVTPSLAISITDGSGRPVSRPDRLLPEVSRPGRYSAVFRPTRQGRFRIALPVPESTDVLQESVEVVVPNVESERPSQDVGLLTKLAVSTGGQYLRLGELAQRVPDLLPDRSEPVVVDEQLATLWDRSWVLYLMAGLLGFEWALRRLLSLS